MILSMEHDSQGVGVRVSARVTAHVLSDAGLAAVSALSRSSGTLAREDETFLMCPLCFFFLILGGRACTPRQFVLIP